jgi:hypothetical protein
MNPDAGTDEKLAYLEFGVPCERPPWKSEGPNGCPNEAEWSFVTNCQCAILHLYCDQCFAGLLIQYQLFKIYGGVTCISCGEAIPCDDPFKDVPTKL